MDLLMDDAVSDAEKALESGQSSFHKVTPPRPLGGRDGELTGGSLRAALLHSWVRRWALRPTL